MKKLYLTGVIVLGIVCITVFAENASVAVAVAFLGSARSFILMFPVFIGMGMGLGALVVLYIQSVYKEREMRSHTNFDI